MSTIDPRNTTIEEKEGGSPADAVPELRAQDPAARAAAERRLTAPPPAGAPLSEGRRAWLGEAYEENRALVARMLKRSDVQPESAPELLHDVFLTLGERARDHEVPANTQAMLVTVTGFAICNHGRRRDHRPPVDDDACADEVPTSRPDGERRVHMMQCERIVAAIVATMPPAAGELIRLIDIEERSLPDAAAIVGRGVALVQKQHERALRKFEELALRYFCSPPGFEE